MTDTNEVMNLQHFRRDPTDIQIHINLAIRIGIRDHFWLKFWNCWRFVPSECSLVFVCPDTAGTDYGDTSSLGRCAQSAVIVCLLYATISCVATRCPLKILPAIIDSAVCISSMQFFVTIHYVVHSMQSYSPTVLIIDWLTDPAAKIAYIIEFGLVHERLVVLSGVVMSEETYMPGFSL